MTALSWAAWGLCFAGGIAADLLGRIGLSALLIGMALGIGIGRTITLIEGMKTR